MASLNTSHTDTVARCIAECRGYISSIYTLRNKLIIILLISAKLKNWVCTTTKPLLDTTAHCTGYRVHTTVHP